MPCGFACVRRCHVRITAPDEWQEHRLAPARRLLLDGSNHPVSDAARECKRRLGVALAAVIAYDAPPLLLPAQGDQAHAGQDW
jgi:hypothetical protein